MKSYRIRAVTGLKGMISPLFDLFTTFYADLKACRKKPLITLLVLLAQIPAAQAFMSAPSARVSGNTLTLSWSAVAGASFYKLEYRDGSGNWTPSGAQYTGTSKTWSGITYLNQRSYHMKSCVSASNCSGWSSASAPVSIFPQPAAPAITYLPASVSSGQQFNIAYGRVTYGDSYKLYQNGSAVASTTGSMFSRVLTSPGSYRYQVQACNISGCGALGAAKTVTVAAAKPAVPGNVTASLSGNDLTLSWTAVSDADYYQLEYRDGSGAWTPSSSRYYSGSHTWYDIPALTASSYHLKACNQGGCSAWSAASNAVTYAPLPATPGTPSVVSNGTSNTLSWTAVSNADDYAVEVNFNDNGWSSVGRVSGVSITWDNLPPGTRSYRLQACNASSCSAYSPVSESITTYAVPDIPGKPVAQATETSITLSWQTVLYAQWYQLQYQDGSAGWEDVGGTFTGTGQTWGNLQGISMRSYRIQGCNEAGCSGWSDPSNAVSLSSKPIEPEPEPVTRQVIFIHTDNLGSPVAQTNENGEVL